MGAILQELKDDILNKVNAKVCAPILRHQGVIPEKIETKIAQAGDMQMARWILYGHLKSDCTLKQIETLAEVLVGVESGFGRTKEVGRQLQNLILIRGSNAHKRRSPSSLHLHSLSNFLAMVFVLTAVAFMLLMYKLDMSGTWVAKESGICTPTPGIYINVYNLYHTV